MLQLTGAVTAFNREDHDEALRIVERFGRTRRNSTWRPFADHLADRIRAVRTSRDPLHTEDLKRALVALLAMWGRAEVEDDPIVMASCQKAQSRLARNNRPEVVRLLDVAEARYRSVACFCLAFSEAPADGLLLEGKCTDPAIPVRRLALFALAHQASPQTNTGVLLTAMGDEDPAVRYRSCLAAKVCVPSDSSFLPEVRSALLNRLTDDSPEVSIVVASALAHIGQPKDIDQIREAARHTEVEGLAEALEQIATSATAP